MRGGSLFHLLLALTTDNKMLDREVGGGGGGISKEGAKLSYGTA